MSKQGPDPFGYPAGQVKAETPDGVSVTYGDGHVYNSLTNGGFAYGGPDAQSHGGFPGLMSEDLFGVMVDQSPTEKFRAG